MGLAGQSTQVAMEDDQDRTTGVVRDTPGLAGVASKGGRFEGEVDPLVGGRFEKP